MTAPLACRDSIGYSRQPAYRRVADRASRARAKAELHAIRAAVRAPVSAGPSCPLMMAPWSRRDIKHLLRLTDLGFFPDHIGLVLQRSSRAVRHHLNRLRPPAPSLLRDGHGKFCRQPEARRAA